VNRCESSSISSIENTMYIYVFCDEIQIICVYAKYINVFTKYIYIDIFKYTHIHAYLDPPRGASFPGCQLRMGFGRNWHPDWKMLVYTHVILHQSGKA